jgi:hypothetical protein
MRLVHNATSISPDDSPKPESPHTLHGRTVFITTQQSLVIVQDYTENSTTKDQLIMQNK